MDNNEVRDEQRWPELHTEIAGSGRLSPALSACVYVSGAWTIVTIAGDMDLQVLPLVHELASADARHLVFDLRQVTFMDACGLDLLVRCQNDALQGGGCVRLVAPSRKVRRVLMLTGANREFTTFPSVEEAMMAAVPGPWR
jgi:anti-sigma B factor antagonist